MSYKILITEDDKDIVTLLKLYLEASDYQVLSCDDGVKAISIMKDNAIDLAIVDIMMPNMDGYELIKQIRNISNIPILIVSAKVEDNDKIVGLNLGADDYISKPFNPMEVVARVSSNIRRFYYLGSAEYTARNIQIVQQGELNLDLQNYILYKNSKKVMLTPTEYKIIVKFMETPGRVFAKSQLYESVNGEFFENDQNTMMVHISNIRDKIEDDPKNPRYIKTVRGIGYKFETQKK